MPARDKPLISDHELVATAALALRARRGAAWARAVPLKIFLNDVLPYRHLDEPYQPWRKLFFQKLAPLVAGASSITEAAQIINRDVWALFSDPPIHFVPDQAPEILSPAQVIAAGFASCSGLSIFLASACRAVGIPARVAGTPSWVEDRRDLSKGDRFNNHNWVEVWDGGAWSFTGACEYRPEGLNRTWFFPQPAKSALPGSTMHAIYAASYQTTGLTFPLAWAPQDREVPAVDVTQGYIDAEEPGPPS
ncbi:transglutaminase domain protein [Monoraphidium neglectum]|uniref:Transglutaminase domain protein n=1 Tax=Monoraphidium neglectum TaxID=145388 RepID=A0A0D2N6D7_9CHLO|nr:transglutaminase domain protein [Monoraphidium neglectum]KIZ07847.1 transglutaminase domain protein [Monoraphidium neglectum]|eukprot:XP_013906866.1 transglutaminase domain protein [Monoraphidium neglectum]